MIGIGVQLGGPEQGISTIEKALMLAMNIAARERNAAYNDGTHSWINPVFIVQGSLLGPDFAGIETGHFSRKAKGLVIKVAVPSWPAEGNDLRDFIVTSLRRCVALAAGQFADKKLSFSTLEAERIILAIDRGLADAT